MRRALLGGWLLAAGGAAAGTPVELAQAEALLEAGRPHLAERQFRALLDGRPKLDRARIGLGRALAATHQCDEALQWLESARWSPAWRVSASLAEGRCLEQRWELVEAAEVYRYAAGRVPRDTAVQLALVRTLGALGEPVEDELDQLALREGGVDLVPVVRAELALREGDEAVDGWLHQVRVQLGPNPVTALIDARAWLDRGDPVAAEGALLDQLRRTPGQLPLVLWRAEAVRRSGRTLDAFELHLSTSLVALAPDPLAVTFRARILVDAGFLEDARTQLAGLEDPAHPEALASRWYLARAAGDLEEAARLAALWRTCERSRLRTLEQLVPVVEPDYAAPWPHPR